MPPGEDLVASLRDQPVDRVIQPTAGAVGIGRSLLQDGVHAIMSRGIKSLPMLECSSERCICKYGYNEGDAKAAGERTAQSLRALTAQLQS